MALNRTAVPVKKPVMRGVRREEKPAVRRVEPAPAPPEAPQPTQPPVNLREVMQNIDDAICLVEARAALNELADAFLFAETIEAVRAQLVDDFQRQDVATACVAKLISCEAAIRRALHKVTSSALALHAEQQASLQVYEQLVATAQAARAAGAAS